MEWMKYVESMLVQKTCNFCEKHFQFLSKLLKNGTNKRLIIISSSVYRKHMYKINFNIFLGYMQKNKDENGRIKPRRLKNGKSKIFFTLRQRNGFPVQKVLYQISNWCVLLA